MRVLGIDYGRKRVGVAVSDDELLSAHGLRTLVNDGRLFTRLKGIIDEYQPARLVVGIACREDGSLSAMGKEADAFRRSLEKKFGIKSENWDESLTTFAAEEVLKDAGLNGQRRRDVADRVAAAIILQDYLDAKREEIKQTQDPKPKGVGRE